MNRNLIWTLDSPSSSQSWRYLSVMVVPCCLHSASLGSAINCSVISVSMRAPFESRIFSISLTCGDHTHTHFDFWIPSIQDLLKKYPILISGCSASLYTSRNSEHSVCLQSRLRSGVFTSVSVRPQSHMWWVCFCSSGLASAQDVEKTNRHHQRNWKGSEIRQDVTHRNALRRNTQGA